MTFTRKNSKKITDANKDLTEKLAQLAEDDKEIEAELDAESPGLGLAVVGTSGSSGVDKSPSINANSKLNKGALPSFDIKRHATMGAKYKGSGGETFLDEALKHAAVKQKQE